MAKPIGLQEASEQYISQQEIKMQEKGFVLKIVVAGESGLGKTTAIRTIFHQDQEESKGPVITPKTTQISEKTCRITEGGFSLALTLVDTVGIGDQLDNRDAWRPILTYINDQMDDYFHKDMDPLRRATVQDGRVHACLYFIAPHRFKEVDIEFLKHLNERVSIVPVLAKADTMTSSEIQEFRDLVTEKLQSNGIQPYQLSHAARTTFAVIGSTERVVNAENRPVLGRQYPWGVCEVENEAHCDIKRLRSLLAGQHMPALLEATDALYYGFRRRKMLKEKKRKQQLCQLVMCAALVMLIAIGVILLFIYAPDDAIYTTAAILGVAALIYTVAFVRGCFPRIRCLRPAPPGGPSVNHYVNDYDML